MNDFFEHNLSTVQRAARIVDIGSFWSKEPPILDEEGKLLRGGMLKHQATCWDLPNFIKILVGGYGSGKTNWICKRIMALALENAPCPVSLVSPTFPLARRTTIATIKEMCKGKRTIYGRGFDWRYNAQANEFSISFRGRNATIQIYSGDDPDSLRGPNLAAAGLDEPFLMPEEVFTQMIARVRHPSAKKMEICLAGTPEQLNWGYDLCIGEYKDEMDVGFVQASTRANTIIGPDYVQRLESALSDQAVKAYVDGDFVNLGSGLVYHAFSRGRNMVEREMPEFAELGVGMDFNVDPMCAAVFWTYKNEIHFIEEILLSNADTEFMCMELRQKYGDRLTNVYPDASGGSRHSSSPEGKTDFHYLRHHNFVINAPHQNPKRRDRYNAVNGKLKPFNGKTSLTISPKCKKLIKYQQTYSYEMMNKQKHMSHLLDAYSYPVSYLFGLDNDELHEHKIQGF